jgi:hypothetical protein
LSVREDLSSVIDVCRLGKNNPIRFIDQRIEVNHAIAIGTSDKGMLYFLGGYGPPYHLACIVYAISPAVITAQRSQVPHIDGICPSNEGTNCRMRAERSRYLTGIINVGGAAAANGPIDPRSLKPTPSGPVMKA